MSKARTIINLLEDYQSFIIHVNGITDPDDAYDKVINNPEAYKDYKLLRQKDNFVVFKDKEERPIGALVEVIRKLWNEDPRISNPDMRYAGMFKLKNGVLIFGVGRI